MKTWTWIWKAIVTLGSLAAVFLAGMVLYVCIRDAVRYRDRPYTAESEYTDTYVLEYDGGTVRLKNAETGRYLTPELDRIYDPVRPGDSLTVYFAGKKRGFLNVCTGQLVSQPEYDRAWIFSEGLGAAVRDGKLGFVNPQNEVVIPFGLEYNGRRQQIDYLFKGGYCPVADPAGRQGLIDRTGRWVVEPQYDCIAPPEGAGAYRIVEREGLYGVLDSTLQLRVPVAYEWIVVERDGFLLQGEADQCLMAFDGCTVLKPFVYDSYEIIYFNSGRLDDEGNDILMKSEYSAYRIGSRYGLMDGAGHRVTAAIYDEISGMANDLFACRIGAGWITVNGNGRTIE